MSLRSIPYLTTTERESEDEIRERVPSVIILAEDMNANFQQT